MIAEAKTILDTSPELPQGRTARAQELLGDAVTLTDHLLTVEPAAVLGKMGGKVSTRAEQWQMRLKYLSGLEVKTNGEKK